MKAIVNGKEIKVLGKMDVGAEFTQKVSELLQKGFIFFYGEGASGTQGEEMQTHLTNDGGKTVYKIYVDRKTFSDFWKEGVVLYVKKYELTYANETIWNNKGEVLFEKNFYCITRSLYDENAVFVDDEKIFKEICDVKEARFEARRSDNQRFRLAPTMNRVVYKILKKRNGYKTMKRKEVEYVEKYVGSDGKVKYQVKTTKKSYPIAL